MENATILQAKKNTSNPDHVSFSLPALSKVEFKNSGEQQCIVLAIDYVYPIKGDVNADGLVNHADLVRLVEIVGSNGEADVNDDGKTDVGDITAILGILSR